MRTLDSFVTRRTGGLESRTRSQKLATIVTRRTGGLECTGGLVNFRNLAYTAYIIIHLRSGLRYTQKSTNDIIGAF